jgi:ribosome-associated protein
VSGTEIEATAIISSNQAHDSLIRYRSPTKSAGRADQQLSAANIWCKPDGFLIRFGTSVKRFIPMGKKSRHSSITDFNDDSEDISKTQKKKMAAELRELARHIAELPKSKQQQLDLPEAFQDAIVTAHKITSHIAKKRHYQYMGKLLIKLDHVAIQEKLNQLNDMDGHYQIRDEVLNAWIEQLDELEAELTDHLYAAHDPDLISTFRQCLRNHRKKPADAATRKKLFQALRQLDKQQELPHPFSLSQGSAD